MEDDALKDNPLDSATLVVDGLSYAIPRIVALRIVRLAELLERAGVS